MSITDHESIYLWNQYSIGMQIGVISDVHANKIALEAVLDDMPAVDQLVCAGDVIGYNPWPGDCVDLVREHCAVTVKGNHDRTFESPERYRANEMAYQGLQLANEQLTDAQKQWVRDLTDRTAIADDRLLLVHSHPDPDQRGTYVRPHQFPQMRRVLREEYDDQYDGVILGHTHIQHKATIDDCLILNPGSVGQPRDGDPQAAYAVVDTEELTATLHRTAYDIDAVRTEINRCNLPQKTGDRLTRGR